ncbi:DUF305 domain-containing protein [Pseudonocardia humida]|uniref:DUF305 domain-containing protein n=1 Tax=Pseudonocardia humida TaxID=2800819 RepID=A0ABT1A572_9PSEU|nr:DUF305 domain-containing protein [Pseudonocardia humida]MCO1658130.1 DUF305 domain-containing protein [Pseudonocardia humida]
MARGQGPAETAGRQAVEPGPARPDGAASRSEPPVTDATGDRAESARETSTTPPGRTDVPDLTPDHDGPPPPDDPERDDYGDPGDDSGEWPREARWVRPFLVVAGVVGLLLLGAAGGLLIGLAGRDDPTVPGIDSVDVGFAQDMTVHHQQAVEMAAWERDHSTDPVLRQLASDIETTQNSQVGRMQGWLELWNAPALPIGGHMAWMSGPTHDHAGGAGAVATMPGMASSADLAALRAATGPQLDVLFLQLMLRHHEGGAAMLEYGSQHAAVPQLRNLARQMLSSQTSESDYLRRLLVERGGQPLPL